LLIRPLLNALLYFPSRAIVQTPAAAGLAFADVTIHTEDRGRLHGWWIRPARSCSAQDGVDPARVVYLGESLGGAVALALALERPPAGLIRQSVFTSVRDMARAHYPRALVPGAYPSLRLIGRLRVPLLVLHGERARHIGHAVARVVAEEGARVVAASRHTDALEGLDGVTPVALDVAAPDAPAELIRRAIRQRRLRQRALPARRRHDGLTARRCRCASAYCGH
jgi:fermentation-respiration switch protein FrsA (DUF1100 family)